MPIHDRFEVESVEVADVVVVALEKGFLFGLFEFALLFDLQALDLLDEVVGKKQRRRTAVEFMVH